MSTKTSFDSQQVLRRRCGNEPLIWNPIPKTVTLSTDMIPQVENSTPDLMWQVAQNYKKYYIKLLFGYMYKVHIKIRISCLDLGPILKISLDISKYSWMWKNSIFKTLLVPSDKEYPICIYYWSWSEVLITLILAILNILLYCTLLYSFMEHLHKL